MIKSAIVLGSQDDKYIELIERCREIVFLATPHQGSDLAKTLSRILGISPEPKSSRYFVDNLLPNPPALETIADRFPQAGSRLQLTSFYETKPSKYGLWKGLVVEKHQAVMNLPNERRIPLEANHSNVASFPSVSDPS